MGETKLRTRVGDHVVMHGQGVKCLHCGATLVLQLPVLVEEWAVANYAFLAKHKRCPPSVEKRND